MPLPTARRASEPRSALPPRRLMLSQSTRRRRRGRPSLVLTLGSIGLLAVGIFGFLFSRGPTRPTARKAAPNLSVEEAPHTNVDIPRRKPASEDTIAERINKNGAPAISSRKSVRAEQDKVMVLGKADSPKTAQMLAKLDEPIRMPFPRETPLVEVLRYVKRATRTPSFAGILIFVDPAGPPGGGSLAHVASQDRPRRRSLEDIPPPDCGTAPPGVLRERGQRDHQLAQDHSTTRGEGGEREQGQEGSGTETGTRLVSLALGRGTSKTCITDPARSRSRDCAIARPIPKSEPVSAPRPLRRRPAIPDPLAGGFAEYQCRGTKTMINPRKTLKIL